MPGADPGRLDGAARAGVEVSTGRVEFGVLPRDAGGGLAITRPPARARPRPRQGPAVDNRDA